MSYNSNDHLEREACESLVASDLSAKMKNWRNQPSRQSEGNTGSPFQILLMLLALGGAAWLFWPKEVDKKPMPREQPAPLPKSEQPPAQQIAQPRPEPIAQKPAPSQAANRYLALAQSNYHSPAFATEIRGDAPTGQDALNDARHALAEGRYSDALQTLQNVAPAYKTDAAYLRGHALFGLKKYAQAAAIFGQLTGSVRCGEAAQWYEVLALLPDFEQAKPLILKKLKRMSEDEGHTFQREAKEMSQLL